MYRPKHIYALSLRTDVAFHPANPRITIQYNHCLPINTHGPALR
jgi:hypothetical protein